MMSGNKELDILTYIFDDNADMYNIRTCKNTPDIEVRLISYQKF